MDWRVSVPNDWVIDLKPPGAVDLKPKDDTRAAIPVGTIELLTLTPAARLANISTSYLRYLADRGKVPVEKTTSGLRLFRAQDMTQLAEKRAMRHHSES